MIDIKLIRKEKDAVEAKLKTKDPDVNLSPILSLDERIRVLKVTAEGIF